MTHKKEVKKKGRAEPRISLISTFDQEVIYIVLSVCTFEKKSLLSTKYSV